MLPETSISTRTSGWRSGAAGAASANAGGHHTQAGHSANNKNRKIREDDFISRCRSSKTRKQIIENYR